ncbi:hypothetical protein [Lysinibacter sp. HNR]|uniref:hypothetical protein n=1 Tax=Lysinibacter sp. HNR TaxID=3031408 RepID=UPI002434E016|nr:hypothetical protein [Lysinibacter sp. HNR]WGD37811.1 hypothetical protein FrondiHNR_02540 [Lysinibacter sp. HNR]
MRQRAKIAAVVSLASVVVGILGSGPVGALWSVPGSVDASVRSDRLLAPPAAVAVIARATATFPRREHGAGCIPTALLGVWEAARLVFWVRDPGVG